ncbi:TPA: hypothetical protein ACG0BA_002244 [Serratia odorifera]
MAKFDRDVQRKLLEILFESFPKATDTATLDKIKALYECGDLFIADLFYLEEHELIVSGLRRGGGKFALNSSAIRITAKGIDFIQRDGGLSAILNVQTVRFHSDTITALEEIISLSNIPEPEKAGIAAKLRELPVSAIEHLTKELVVKGALSLPAALPLIQKFLHLA